MTEKIKTGKESFLYKIRKFLDELGLFVILVFLPAFSIGFSFYYVQQSLLEDSSNDVLNEMSEITAHMIRTTEPETYYQESLRRLAESFKWAESIDEVSRIENKDLLELALFDEKGERLNWPVGEKLVKTKFSKDYLNLLKRLSHSPESILTRDERNTAIGYSGNEMTLSLIAASPNTLINFQGIGLRKMGGWFKVKLKSKKDNIMTTGDLIAWLNLDKIDRYSLAEKTIKSMGKLTNSQYTYSYIDLRDTSINKCSRGRKFKEGILKVISSNSLKSNFIYENELFAINDTQEGLRLICSRPCPSSLPLLKNYKKLIFILIPILVFLFIWKKVFKVKMNLSIKKEIALIFGYASIVGFITILISNIAYQYEKQITITQKYENEAIEILEKVDQQYSDSFEDLIYQYRHLNDVISKTNNNPATVLAPLLKAQKEDIISYAVYVDSLGKIVFQAPQKSDLDKSTGLARKYGNIVNRVAIKSLKTYNSSRSKIKYDNEPVSVSVLTMNAVEGLLSDRSKFIEIKFNNDEPLAYLDLSLDNDSFAKGCLLIIHEPSKLEMNYLNETRQNLSKTKDFELIAFPKNSTDINSYYPKFSYSSEEPLWKLNDMVNQNQLPCFKRGKVRGKECLVAALPANKMKNYNLFLAMPLDKLDDKVFSLSNVLLIGTTLSLIFIIIISLLLINYISIPINIINQNATIIEENKTDEKQLLNPDSSELESITNGLTNLVIKTKQFGENRNICNKLLPFNPYIDSRYEINRLSSSNQNPNTFSYISQLEDNFVHVYFINCKSFEGLNSTIPLSMATTAMKLFTEQLSLRSPSTCLINLKDYFRVNFKSDYQWSVISIFLDLNNNKIIYSKLGEIDLIKIDFNTLECEKINKNNKSDNNSLYQLEDYYSDFTNESCFVIAENNITDEKINILENKLKDSILSKSNFKDCLVNIFDEEQNCNEFSDSVYLFHREENKTLAQANRSLAESNPIAFIRSQKTGISNDE